MFQAVHLTLSMLVGLFRLFCYRLGCISIAVIIVLIVNFTLILCYKKLSIISVSHVLLEYVVMQKKGK